MLVEVVPDGTVAVLVSVTLVVPCTVRVDVIVVLGFARAVATTETVVVLVEMDRHLHALDNVGPDAYARSADGLGTVGLACLFWF